MLDCVNILNWCGRLKSQFKTDCKSSSSTLIGVNWLLKSRFRSTFFPGVRGGIGTDFGDCGDAFCEFKNSVGFVLGDLDTLPMMSIRSSLQDERLSFSSEDSEWEIGSKTGSTEIVSKKLSSRRVIA